MEVFEVPVKDAKGRVVNPEDAEARQAAREKHAAQRKQAAEKAAEKAAQPLDAPADPAPGRKRRRVWCWSPYFLMMGFEKRSCFTNERRVPPQYPHG